MDALAITGTCAGCASDRVPARRGGSGIGFETTTAAKKSKNKQRTPSIAFVYFSKRDSRLTPPPHETGWSPSDGVKLQNNKHYHGQLLINCRGEGLISGGFLHASVVFFVLRFYFFLGKYLSTLSSSVQSRALLGLAENGIQAGCEWPSKPTNAVSSLRT